MRLPLLCRHLSRTVIVLLAFAASGCGLGSYETKMLEAQNRLAHFAREDKELAGPLQAPKVVQKYAEEVFLRVPKGISTTVHTVDGVEMPFVLDGLFYQYSGTKDILALYVAWAGEKEKNFATRVRGANAFNNAGRKDSLYTTVPAPGRNPLTLNATTYELPDRTYHVYLEPNQKVALVFEVSKSALVKPTTDTINLSLGTLALGADAFEQAKEYKNRTKGTKK